MKHGRARVAAIAVAVIVASIATTQAFASQSGKTVPGGAHYVSVASGSDPANAVETVDGIPATQVAGVFHQGLPTTAIGLPHVGLPGVTPLSPNGCLNAGVNWQSGNDIVGLTVWKIWNHTHWCFSNWQVTSVTGWTDVFTAPGWGSGSISWGWGWWSQPATARSTSHAHFCLGAFYGCIQSADPNVNTWVNGAGNYSYDGSNWSAGN